MRQRRFRALAAAAGTIAVSAIGLAVSPNAAAYTPTPGTVLTPDNLETCNKYPCVLYPKTAQLPSGRIVLAFEDSRGALDGQDIPIWKSDDNGDSWQPLAEVGSPADMSSDPAMDTYISNWTNPYLYVMPETVGHLAEGTLLLASVVSGDDEWYNQQKAIDPNWLPDGDGDRRDVSVALYSSTDQGASWSFEDIVAEGGWQGGSAGRPWIHSDANVDDQQDPLWEPHVDVVDGELVVWYSDENDYVGYDPETYVPELAPNNDTGEDSGGQVLVHKTWDGSSWSEPVLDVAGVTETVDDGTNTWDVIGGGRPGMITHAATTDGKWIQTFEYFGGGWNVRMKICDDLLHCDPWDGSTWGEGPWEDGPGIAGGSPVLLELPDGRIAYNDADRGDVIINESGLSTSRAPRQDGDRWIYDRGWTARQTTVDPGYSRNLQYVKDTGQLLVVQASWTAPGTASPITFGHVDIGRSAGSYYTLVNRKTGEVLSTAQDNVMDFKFYPWENAYQPDVITWGNNPDNDTQRWHLRKNADGTVTHLNKGGGRALSIDGGTAQGRKLVQWVHNEGPDQSWTLVPSDDGYVKLQPSNSSELFATGYYAGGNVDAYPIVEDGHASDWRVIGSAGFKGVAMEGTNTKRAGITVPLRFEFLAGDTEITDASTITMSAKKYTTCGGWGHGGTDVELASAGGSKLRYDDVEGQFVFNWRTPAGGGCYAVTATSTDGSSITAQFRVG